jgi:hypothetical protein
MLAKRTGVTPQHALRFLETAKAEAQEITKALVLRSVQACADVEQGSNLVCIDSSQDFYIGDISACAESYDEYLTAQEVAAILKISTDTVIRRFESLPGVLDLGSSESRFKRRYRVIRIPRQTLERFILETRICA